MQLDLFKDNEAVVTVTAEECYTCVECKETKPLTEFYTYEGINISGARRKCKPCYIASSLLVRDLKKVHPYPGDNPVCDCCGVKSSNEILNLDHCHITKKFRGYLCRNCNVGIGSLGDDIEGLERALTYLRTHYDRRS